MDCLIIGAGLIGASLAWRLGQRGHSVTLVDAGKYFGEASSAGAGMLSPLGERFPNEAWGERAQQSLRMYPEFVAELERESRLSIDFAVCGAIDEGREYPDEAIVDPRDIGWALRNAFEHYDITLVEDQPVMNVEASADGVRAGEFVARTAVIAAGAWSGGVTVNGQALPATVPVKGFLLGYHDQPKLGATRRAGHTYVLQRSNGYTIAGSTEQSIGFDREMDETLVAELRQRAGEVWAPLAEAAPDDVWSGLRPSTESGAIYVERWPATPVWLAYGHYRNGILLAPWTADYLAGEVSGAL